MIKIIATSIIMVLSVSVTGTVQGQTPISVAKTVDDGVKPKGFNYKKHYRKQKRMDRKRLRKGIRCSWMDLNELYNYQNKKSL